MSTQQHRRAVSMVELLISISIGAILAGIACTAAGSMRSGVRQMVCASHLRQIGRSVAVYQADWGDADTSSESALASNLCLPPQDRLQELLETYGATQPVRRCSDASPNPSRWMDYAWLPVGANQPPLSNEQFCKLAQKQGNQAVLAADFHHRESSMRSRVPRTRTLLLHLNRTVTTHLADGLGLIPSTLNP